MAAPGLLEEDGSFAMVVEKLGEEVDVELVEVKLDGVIALVLVVLAVVESVLVPTSEATWVNQSKGINAKLNV